MIYRLVPAKWTTGKKVLEGRFSDDQIHKFNAEGYNIYYFPNYPSNYITGTNVTGRDIDVFNWTFVDCDLKDRTYASKEHFYETIGEAGITPTRVVDSGNGVHVYWEIANLDAKAYLRFQRRLVRLFKTDEATTTLNQLLRAPGSVNVKDKENFKLCEEVFTSDKTYSAEEFDKLLPTITQDDEKWCNQHYDRAFNINQNLDISEKLPPKFGKFLLDNPEAKELFSGQNDDRSKADYRLGHLMFANGFTKDEALSVLINSVKAMERAPIHRANYAQNIVDKIWTYEEDNSSDLSKSVRSILKRGADTIKGTRFPCHPVIDSTVRGFRLTDVLGLVGGSGIGKTAVGLNMFRWFSERNPDYHHFFVSLEQPDNQIAQRWETITEGDTSLDDKVHVLGNYNEDGSYRNLSLFEIQEYIETWQKKTGNKVGCVMIDHLGALAKKGKKDDKQDLIDICHSMKSFAVQTNTFLVMQSQTSREKAGIGDLELDKDAAYGTATFEWYCDYLMTMWQPLKRCASEESCPTITAFKFCKIRHKKPKRDIIREDVCYYLYFDSETEQLRDLTEDEEKSFDYFLSQATNKRKHDKKTELIKYISVPWKEHEARTKDNPKRT